MQDLPQELGNLQECWELKLQGLRMQKADLQEAVRSEAYFQCACSSHSFSVPVVAIVSVCL